MTFNINSLTTPHESITYWTISLLQTSLLCVSFMKRHTLKNILLTTVVIHTLNQINSQNPKHASSLLTFGILNPFMCTPVSIEIWRSHHAPPQPKIDSSWHNLNNSDCSLTFIWILQISWQCHSSMLLLFWTYKQVKNPTVLVMHHITIIMIVLLAWCWTLPLLQVCSRLDNSALDDRRLPDQCWVVLNRIQWSGARCDAIGPTGGSSHLVKGPHSHQGLNCGPQVDRHVQRDRRT